MSADSSGAQAEVLAKTNEDSQMSLASFLLYSADENQAREESLFQVHKLPTESELNSPQKNLTLLPPHEGISTSSSPNNKPKFKLYSIQKSTVRLHSCVECGKSFPNPYAMKSHVMRYHSRKRTHPCLNCGQRFQSLSELKDHLASHSLHKQYRCPECDEGFSEYGHLTQHMKIHVEEKLYLCTDCGKQFSYECNFNRHQLMHHQEETYQVAIVTDENTEEASVGGNDTDSTTQKNDFVLILESGNDPDNV